MMVTLLFPGQGSQEPGMGKALAHEWATARRTFEEADDALGMALSRVCFEGDESELRRTEVTQPAILTVSVAIARCLFAERPDLALRFAAGHSLGEWSALVAVGGLSFSDAVRAVRERGRLMQAAVADGEGAMAAVIGLDRAAVIDTCARIRLEMDGAVVVPANFNSPEQTVISGHRTAVDAASRAVLTLGAQKVVPLAVSAPFHSPLMEPAARALSDVLEPLPTAELRCPVVSNVETSPNQDAGRIKPLLIQQVTAPVRWVESIEAIAGAGETTALELGPGKVLMGLARRIDRRLKVTSVSDPGSLAKALESLAANSNA